MSDTIRRPRWTRDLRYAPPAARHDLARQTHRGMRRDAVYVLGRVRVGVIDPHDALLATRQMVSDPWNHD